MAKSAQEKETKKWNEENRAHRNYLTKRSTARGFIRNHATIEDLEELKKIILKKLKKIHKSS